MTAHTPGPSDHLNFGSSEPCCEVLCGKCQASIRVTHGFKQIAIEYCPLHAAAPALLEALKTMLAEAGTRYSPGTEQARAAIALTRGGENVR